MTTTQANTKIQLKHFWSGEGNLSYLVVNPDLNEGFLIDPDIEILGTYLLTLDREQIALKAVIDTHNHAEHATAAPALVKLFGIPYLMNHRASSSFVSDRLQDKDERVLAGISVGFLSSPGHTPEMQSVRIENHLFTGDSLFNRSCGRADLPGGDAGIQFDTLQKLMGLPDATVVHPGHDYDRRLSSTIGEIRQANPRVQFTDRQAFVEFMTDFYRDNEKPDDLEYYVAFNSR